MQVVTSCQLPMTFIVLTFNRYCSIIYSGNAFFKSSKFIAISIGIQWFIGFLIALPFPILLKPYCAIPFWLMPYYLLPFQVIPPITVLVLNLLIFKYAHSSTRRVQPQHSTTIVIRPKISARDLHLLKHIFVMFWMYFVGAVPIYFLVAFDYAGVVSAWVYTILELLNGVSCICWMIDLYLCNNELRSYLKAKILGCF
ncbi:unnamed protein product [Adineta steineri]|uniref:G-protein coupled receptors family 1 profile domain-containing protein n=1 Tax=Adineta steineri TaxID=433720 RepID=A0A819LS87_9BILA|nr:unnamed protein product [Adineta steineri]CAF3968109.1 unnamed protein product [Adineta steineri]